MKKALTLAVALVMLVSLFSACNGNNAPQSAAPQPSSSAAPAASSSAAQSSEPTQNPITLQFWRTGTGGVWQEYWEETMAEFTAMYPHISFEYAEVAWGNDFETKLNAAFATNTAPDILMHAIASMAMRASLGQYQPIDDYVAAWSDKDDIVDNAYSIGTYKGKIYGIPHYPAPTMICYRKDFFREAGLDPDNPPTTWEGLADAAEALTVRDGDIIVRSGLTITQNNFKLLVPFFRMNGGKIFNEDDDSPAWDSPEMVETLEYFVDLVSNRKVTAEVMEADEDNLTLFAQSKSAMSFMQSAWLNQMFKEHPELREEVGVLEISKNGRSNVWAGAEFLYMISESEHKDEVWDFMTYNFEPEKSWSRYLKTGCPTVRKSQMDQYINEDPFMHKALQRGIEIGEGAAKVSWGAMFLNTYLPQAQQEAYYGQKTAEQAIKDAVEQLKKEIA